MNSLIMIIVSAAFINNVILSQFLGICSFLGVSNKIKTSASLGGAVIFVMTIASAVAYILYTFILAPLGLDYLQTIVFILVIAALVQIVEMFLKKTSPALYTALGIYLPLITTNCAVLGVALNNVTDGYDFIESVVSGFGTAVGYTIAIVLLAGIREQIADNDIPEPVKGAPLVLFCATLMGMAFFGSSALSWYSRERNSRSRSIPRKRLSVNACPATTAVPADSPAVTAAPRRSRRVKRL